MKKLKTGISVVFILFWTLAPIYWALRTSLLSNKALTTLPPKYLPIPLSLQHYQQLLGFDKQSSLWVQFKGAMVNTSISCLGSTVVVVIVSILAGYAFARIPFKGRNIIFSMILITMALPAYAVMIPLYKVMISIGLIDTQVGITLIYVSAFAPLAVWLMRSYFATIPKELEEAATVDGATKLRALWTILPIALPGVVAVAILTFLNAWSQFLIPLVFAPSETKPLTVLITEFVGRTSINYGLMTAAGVITMIPPILIVIFLNKYLVSGLTTAAVKQ
ncbi:MAG TPA: carbohydrate ABC transporter permease [Bacillales bacterium]|nr:carbohydrate ABC transporter permease [Bacillales bacterium]